MHPAAPVWILIGAHDMSFTKTIGWSILVGACSVLRCILLAQNDITDLLSSVQRFYLVMSSKKDPRGTAYLASFS